MWESISNPPEPNYRQHGLQKLVHKRLKSLTHHYKIEDDTRFKYVLALANPTAETSLRMMRLIRSYPHLYISIFRYFSRYRILPPQIAKQLYMILRDEALYPSFSAQLLYDIMGKVPDRLLPVYNKHIEKLFLQEEKIGRSDLKAACGGWLLQNRVLSYAKTKQLVIGSKNWWIKVATLPYVDMDFIGKPSYGHLLNHLTKGKSVDGSILAAYLISVNDVELTATKTELNEAASLLLKEFGVIRRTRSFTCGIEAAVNTMIKVPIIDIKWRIIFSAKYSIAEKKIVRAKSYFKTDPTAWVNIIDTFNDLLLDALFSHDCDFSRAFPSLRG